jgi:drug/metabolite transporter (DMT)-like permease
VFFVVLPLAIRTGLAFWPALLVASVATAISYGAWVWAARRIGLNL